MCSFFLYVSNISSYSLWRDVGVATISEMGISLAKENDGLFTHPLIKKQSMATTQLKQTSK